MFKQFFKNLNSHIVDLEIQFIDSNTGEEKINGRYKKVGQNYTTAKPFEGTNYKKLLSKNIEIGRPKFNLFSNPFFKKIKDSISASTFFIFPTNCNGAPRFW
mgnify:CR=1 FL=1